MMLTVNYYYSRNCTCGFRYSSENESEAVGVSLDHVKAH